MWEGVAMPASSVMIALDQFTTFGDLLKYLRRRAGLTQRELSIAVGYSDTQISRLEQNERLPDLATLTARFLPALHTEDQPEVAARLLELAATMRREDAPASGLAPYKGLYYFGEADAELFFGREALTNALLEKLTTGLESDQRFLAIVGASGSGKSSVVRAGLIPALRWQPTSSGWPVYTLTPMAHPLEALAASLSEEHPRGLSSRRWVDDLEANPQALRQGLERSAAAGGTARTLLVVDQFEELFTLCRSEQEQAAFIENLMNSATAPSGPAIVIIVLRADFYAHCARFASLRQALAQRQEYIGPMSSAELRLAIEEPARRGHWELEPGLVDILLHDIGAAPGHTPEPGALPLLSHALLETWQRRRGRTLTISGYNAAGGVRSAIAETAEAVFFDQLDVEQRPIARQIFLRLTELGDDGAGDGAVSLDGFASHDTRRRVTFTELISTPEASTIVQEVLNTLANARLITTDQNTAEVAHEALIREWPTLRRWLEEDRDGLRLHRHLTEAAQEWENRKRDPDGLYRGARLAQALEWSIAHAADLNIQERAFLEASQALAEQESREREAQRQRELETALRFADSAHKLAETETRRAEEQTRSAQRLRQRGAFLAITALAAILLAVTAIWFGQRAAQNEKLATSRELAAAAISNLQVDPERSLLLALQALQNANTLEARNALHQSLPELHLLRTIPTGHTGGAAFAAYSPDGARLASIGANGDIKVWNASTGEQVFVLPSADGDVGYSIAFSPDGNLLAAALNTKVIVLETATGKEAFSLVGTISGAPNNEMVNLAFSPDSRRLAVANFAGSPKIWDVANRTEVFSLVGHAQPCDGIAYSPDGRLLATSDDMGVVKTWDAATGRELLTLTMGGNVHSVAFSPDSGRLAAASEDGALKVWQIATGQEILSLRGNAGMYGVIFLPDGKRLVTAGQDGAARVWDAATGQELLTLAGNTSTVTSVTVSPDGMRIASSGYDGTLKIWDPAPGRELLTLEAHTDIAWDVAYSPDGTRLATVSADGSIKLWDAVSGQSIGSFSPGDGLTSLAFSPDGKQLAAGGAAGTVILLDAVSSKPVMNLPGHAYLVFDLAFSPDGKQLVTSSWDGTAKLWDLASGRELQTFPGQWSGVAFSPDGKSLFTGGLDRYVHHWDAATGQELQKFGDGDGGLNRLDVYGVAVSPDGKLLAVGQQDGAVTLWEIASGTKLRTLLGHAGLVARLAFSQDSCRLASASFDRLAKVWDVASGEESFTLFGHAGNVFGVAFSPDGNRLATVGADGTVRLFTLRLDDLVALGRTRATRALTAEECHKFLHRETCP
jgi:WD40 repeat protein/transcriptional regulator with XRE-family HTH domain